MARAPTTLRLAPLTFVAAVSVLSALGLAGAWIVAKNATAPGVILWMLPSVVVGALFTVYGTVQLQSSIAGASLDTERRALWQQGYILFGVFAVFTLTVSAASFLYVSDLRTTVRQQRLDAQAAIAGLKAQFTEKWLVERSLDAQGLAASIENLPLSGSARTKEVISLIEVMFAEILAKEPEVTAAKLFAPDGRVVARAGEDVGPNEGGLVSGAASTPGAAPRPRILERRLSPTGALRLDFVIPLTGPPTQPGPDFLVVTVDPAKSLLPEVQRWPVSSATSEVVIVRRDGDRAVFVVPPLRAARGADGPLAIPLTQTSVVAVQAILNGDGVHMGSDYRGVPVLAATHHIEGLDWQVIAKTDVTEALTPIDRRARLVVWLTLGAILVAAATSIGLWQVERANVLTLHRSHEHERTALARHYEQMMKRARDIVMLVDAERRIVDANAAALAAYGYSFEELRNMHASDLRPASARAALEADWVTIHVAEKPIETVHQRKDRSTFPVEITGNSFDVDGRRYFQAFIRDISERKRLEAELARLARVQAALQAAAGLLLRARSETELYQGMCDLLINVGGYRLAHVALARLDAEKSVEFVAVAGRDEGYLAQSQIAWDDGPRSKGPTGTAIRTGEVQVNQDFETNADVAPWRDEALKRGLRSSIGLPLRVSGAVFGALTIYSEGPLAFNKDEVAFLVQFAADVSYGVTLLRKRA